MKKPVYITTDSTCDLKPELLERFQIKVIPLHVLLGEESFLDGVDFTPEMIFKRYREEKILPRTAAVTPQEFVAFFAPLVADGHEVVHLSLSAELSSTCQNAVIAAGELSGVYPVDSRQLTIGMGLMLFEACRLRDEGKDAAEIAAAMEGLSEKVNTSFLVDTLEYLWKGGRCSGVAALGANLLSLKPCLQMQNGKLEVCKKYRGSVKKAFEVYMRERLQGKNIRLDYAFIGAEPELDTDSQQKYAAMVREIVPIREIFFTGLNCTVAAHCGPGTMGILFLEE